MNENYAPDYYRQRDKRHVCSLDIGEDKKGKKSLKNYSMEDYIEHYNCTHLHQVLKNELGED